METSSSWKMVDLGEPVLAYIPQIVAETLTDGRVTYVATHHLLPGVIADDETPELARSRWLECLDSYRKHMDDNNLPMPEPQDRIYKAVVPN